VPYGNLGISQLATLYYKVPVSATYEGASVNPTGLPVSFAFVPQATQIPQSADWITGSWETIADSLLFPYSARCLVGPAGAITLSTGVYVAYIKIVGDPETDVEIVGYLEIS
jgi:hypothetical protein